MPHHVAAYTGNVAVVAETELSAVTDNYFVIQNNHFLPQRDMPLLFALIAGLNLSRGRINTPSLGVVASPNIYPLSGAAAPGSPPRFADYVNTPLLFRALEEIQLFTTQPAAVAQQNFGILGFSMGAEPAPGGNIFTIRGTATGALTANAWTNVGTVTWQNVLPSGVYAVVGAMFESAGALAGRLILENTAYRPGGLGVQSVNDVESDLFRRGGLGVWGRFHNYAMPQVEMLSASADASETIALDIVKVG